MSDTQELLPHIKLRFNIEHPTFEESYIFGYECALADADEKINPYQSGTQEHEQWSEGWWAGFYNEKPLFSLDDAHLNQHTKSANEQVFADNRHNMLVKFFEISGVIVMSAIVGYQIFELVA
jgi:hypothetical protein